MDEGTEHRQYFDEGIEHAYRLSWTSYVLPVVITLVFWSISIALYHVQPWVGIGIFVFFLLLLVVAFLSRRVVRLYANDHGIWVRSGFLPWTRGVSGVQWRDVEDAVYFTGFLAWAFNSYRIRVGHRFTKSSEIVLNSVANGRRFVEDVNRRMIEYQREQAVMRRSLQPDAASLTSKETP